MNIPYIIQDKGQTMSDWINLNDKVPEDDQIILIYVPENDREQKILMAKFSKGKYIQDSEASTFPICADYNGTYSEEYKAFKDFVFWMNLPNVPEIKL